MCGYFKCIACSVCAPKPPSVPLPSAQCASWCTVHKCGSHKCTGCYMCNAIPPSVDPPQRSMPPPPHPKPLPPQISMPPIIPLPTFALLAPPQANPINHTAAIIEATLIQVGITMVAFMLMGIGFAVCRAWTACRKANANANEINGKLLKSEQGCWVRIWKWYPYRKARVGSLLLLTTKDEVELDHPQPQINEIESDQQLCSTNSPIVEVLPGSSSAMLPIPYCSGK